MKTALTTLLHAAVLVILMAIGTSIHAAPIVNGNFEAGLANWTTFGAPGGVSTQGFAAETGTLGLWIPSYNSTHAAGLHQDVTIGAGETLTFSGHFKREPNAVLSVLEMKMEFYDQSNTLLGTQLLNHATAINASAAGPWITLSVTGTTPLGTVRVRLKCSYDASIPLNGENGLQASVFADNLSLASVSDPVVVTSSNVIIGKDDFDYANGAIAGQAGGSNWDFDNTTNNDAFVGFTRQGKSTWDAVSGTPTIAAGALTTQNAAAKREYGAPIEVNGAVNEAPSTAYKQVYFRVQMTRAPGATKSSISSNDFNVEHIAFGVPLNPNPASNIREFGIEQGGVTYSGVPVVDGRSYSLVAKLDFVNDTLALYLDPDFTLPESANIPVVTRPYIFGNWSTAVQLGSAGTGSVSWDQLVVGTSWGALQQAYRVNVPVTGPDAIVGTDTFDYPATDIAGRDGGTHFDFDNNNADGFVGHTQVPSTWQNAGPYVDGQRQMLGTWDSVTWRNYGSASATDGTFRNAATSQYKQLYYRFEVIRSSGGVNFSGASSMDGNTERVLFGVPYLENPASAVRELGIHNLDTNTHAYTSIAPVIGARYTLVAKMDFSTGMCSLFVNPDFSGGEPTPAATLAWTGGVSTGIRFGSGGTAPVWWDNVAVTTSWNALRNLFPSAQSATGSDIIIGADSFSYPNGGMGGKSGGLHWDFENRSFGDGTANYTQLPANWDVLFGEPSVTGGIVSTQEAAIVRQYNSTEADGAINNETGTVQRQVYYRFEMNRTAAATWSGVSFNEFNDERVFVGVPFQANPASGAREFGIHDLVGDIHAYAGVQPVAGQAYIIVAKLDYNASLISLWINPNLALTETANAPNATLPYISLNWNTAIRLGSGGTSPTMWDNVSVGASWRSIQAALTPPLTVDDAVTMRQFSKVRVDVKRNDAGTGTVQIVTPPASGAASVDSDGRIFYAHTNGTPVSDTLTYRLSGLSADSAPATVTFNFSSAMRLPNTTSNVPLTAPTTGFAVVDALPGVEFTAPSVLSRIPGSSTKLIVGERGGKIWLIPDITAPVPAKQLLIDLAAIVDMRSTERFKDDMNERGLKGVTFHPDFAVNGQFFVAYCLTINNADHVRLSRFTTAAGNPNLGDVNSEQAFLTQVNDGHNHNMGDVTFGPDRYLYFCAGDEGPPTNAANNNSQIIDKDFWSAIFRIDVDRKPANLEPNAHSAIALNAADSNRAFYKVPADNPFIGATQFNGVALADPSRVRTEMYAVGFRNPWQISFDSQAPHEMWCGDVGDASWEEIDIVTLGGNYQWPYREGNTAGPWISPPPGFSGAAPLWTYPHGNGIFAGNSVTCGIVYRGTQIPTLAGKFVFADFISGHIWTLQRNGGNLPTVERIAGEAGICAIDYDPSNGDVLMLDYGDGKVRRLTTQTVFNSFPQKLSDTGLFADITDLTPNPGVEPYSINLPFWSDYARKSRWFMLPETGSTFGYVQDGNWTLPNGSLWIKHFEMDMTRGISATARRLETRLLVKTAGGSYGVSYRWNDEGTEAYLVDDNGADFDMPITVSGTPYTQHWSIPSRAQCLNCHTPQGRALSWDTRQLNHAGTLAGHSDNFLKLLTSAGYLSNAPAPSMINSLPKYFAPTDITQTLETRTRSWLAVNCSYCHRAGGTGGAQFDLRPELSLSDTKIIDGPLFNSLNVNHRAIVRGNPATSVILQRMAVTGGYTRMPPLATAEIDQSGIQIVTDWINESVNRSTYDEWRIAYFGNTSSGDGDPNFDADGDGFTNYGEFLGMTLPLSSQSFLQPGITVANGNVTLIYPNIPGRIIYVETSTNLLEWTIWDIPSHNGLPIPGGGAIEINSPLDTPNQFFRLNIREQ